MDNSELQSAIMEKARRLHAENQLLKDTLDRMQVVEADQIDDPSINSEEEELMRLRYFEALRRQHFEEQMRQQQIFDYRYSESHSRG
mmetsp:Transcript_9268/g.12611  ORF Transcript_9268/g.12611 Transcript_9268/m.12611 type:complete len:87 (-) Transcript_9268:1321-1581(-)|eukprot:CAMPEP_0170464852 /NCGR_PEP_ID=MMETSP0123-20130129/9409_1 /TAXON_ID=182087 /ORGANISM="Favella ehrenbergii, Strain Fehren 1" /LENGTH=86 /DNA_ID=CAMNT_0010730589 /DNA_START=258 /DNA_END=518 /DNA_ORIENTATION=+